MILWYILDALYGVALLVFSCLEVELLVKNRADVNARDASGPRGTLGAAQVGWIPAPWQMDSIPLCMIPARSNPKGIIYIYCRYNIISLHLIQNIYIYLSLSLSLSLIYPYFSILGCPVSGKTPVHIALAGHPKFNLAMCLKSLGADVSRRTSYVGNLNPTVRQRYFKTDLAQRQHHPEPGLFIFIWGAVCGMGTPQSIATTSSTTSSLEFYLASHVWVVTIAGWWFGTFFMFPFSWDCHHPNWLSLHHFSEG